MQRWSPRATLGFAFGTSAILWAAIFWLAHAIGGG